MCANPLPAKDLAGSQSAAAAYAGAEHRITRARASLVMDHPFFGSLALRLRLKADPACADMWTDGKTLAYNPAFAAALSPDSLVGAMAHEVLHLAFGHHLRRKGRDAAQWNRACDLAINHILLESGFTLPQGFAHNPAYAGMNADEIFEALASLQEAPENKGAKSAQAAQGTEKSKGAGSAGFEGGEQTEPAAQPQNSQGDRQQDKQQNSPDPRAAAGSRTADKGRGKPEQSEGKTSFTGEVADHPDAQGAQNDQALKAAEQEADIAMMQALNARVTWAACPPVLPVSSTMHGGQN